MRTLYAVARMALAWVFIWAGLDVVRRPLQAAKTAGPLLEAARARSPVAIPDDETIVRANAAAQLAAGTALAAGIAPRLAAGVLIGSLVPTTYAGHRFWTFDEHAQRTGQRNHFNKNLGLFGGLLLVILGGGKHGGSRW